MVNKFKPHLLILPEDDNTRQLANGFIQHFAVNENVIFALPEAAGWPGVRDQFLNVYVKYLRNYSAAHIILLIDFDNKLADRRKTFLDAIPPDIADRVFLLGCLDEPESFRTAVSKSLERIGTDLA